MNILSTAIKISLISLAISFIFIKLIAVVQEPVYFQSLESLAPEGKPVFNEIKWYQLPDKDVWMMNQNNEGDIISHRPLDRLAIIINKTVSPPTAQFMQLQPGPLVWSDDLISRQIDFKISCFTCHANGLRKIRRIDYGSVAGKLLDGLKIKFLNSKIKSYGHVIPDPIHNAKDTYLKTPFRKFGNSANEELKLYSCLQCHNGKYHSALTRQNASTISFQVKNRLMPPSGRLLSAEDQNELTRFLNGI